MTRFVRDDVETAPDWTDVESHDFVLARICSGGTFAPQTIAIQRRICSQGEEKSISVRWSV
jgi:hypothetical protein